MKGAKFPEVGDDTVTDEVIDGSKTGFIQLRRMNFTRVPDPQKKILPIRTFVYTVEATKGEGMNILETHK